MEDMHHDIVLLDVPDSTLNLLVENMSKVGECCDKVTDCVIIAKLSILVVLLHIEFSRDPGSLELAFQD